MAVRRQHGDPADVLHLEDKIPIQAVDDQLLVQVVHSRLAGHEILTQVSRRQVVLDVELG